jgi:hypothetical protein
MHSKGIKIVLLILAGTIATFPLRGQHLTSKTNDFYLNLKSPFPNTGQLPYIKWIQPQLDYTNSMQNKINIEAKIINRSPLKEIKLSLGNMLDGSIMASKIIPIKFEQREYLIQEQVTLLEGSNFILLEATTEQGVIISDRRQVIVGKAALENMVALDRKDYVLMFATDKYDNWDDLVNPINDAEAIAKELKVKYGFQVDLVKNPTVEQIWEKLREYNERKFSPQDQLLVFFAGHGHFDESFGEGYVVAKNSLSNDLSRTTYLSHNRLRGVINNISCSHILLTMDVCFGGTLDPQIAKSRGAVDEVSDNQLLARKWSHRTRKYLTSGGKEYVSDGIAEKHSPFAGKLIEALRSYGGGDGILTLSELQVSLEKLKQLPRFGSFGDDEPLSDFVFVGKR